MFRSQRSVSRAREDYLGLNFCPLGANFGEQRGNLVLVLLAQAFARSPILYDQRIASVAQCDKL